MATEAECGKCEALGNLGPCDACFYGTKTEDYIARAPSPLIDRVLAEQRANDANPQGEPFCANLFPLSRAWKEHLRQLESEMTPEELAEWRKLPPCFEKTQGTWDGETRTFIVAPYYHEEPIDLVLVPWAFTYDISNPDVETE